MGYHSIIDSGSHSGSSSDIGAVISLDSCSQFSVLSGQYSLFGGTQSTKSTSHTTLRGYRLASLDSGYRSQISVRCGQSSLSSGTQSTKTTSHNTLRGYCPALQQVLVDKHLLIELAEELNKTDVINSDALAIVQNKENRKGVDVILNLLEMKVAQEPDKLKDVINIVRKVLSLRRVFNTSQKRYPETYYI